MEKVGAELLYLPSYSPHLNPIEKSGLRSKQMLRQLKARTAEALHQAVAQALPPITPENTPAWFRFLPHKCIPEGKMLD